MAEGPSVLTEPGQMCCSDVFGFHGSRGEIPTPPNYLLDRDLSDVAPISKIHFFLLCRGF